MNVMFAFNKLKPPPKKKSIYLITYLGVQEMVTLDVSSSVVREGETVEVIVNLSSALDSEDIVVCKYSSPLCSSPLKVRDLNLLP